MSSLYTIKNSYVFIDVFQQDKKTNLKLESKRVSWAPLYCRRATCNSDVVAPINANPLIVKHAYRKNNVAVNVAVEGTDVMGSCVHPSLATSVDSCTAEMSMTVSASDCSYPVIVIVDRTPLFTSPRVSHRSAQLDLHARIDIHCRTTLRNIKVLPFGLSVSRSQPWIN